MDVDSGILGAAELRWVDDEQRGASVGADRVLDCAGGGAAAGRIVVEAERDRLDAAPCKAFEQFGPAAGAAERADTLDPLRSQEMDVDHAFDEENLAARVERCGEERGEPVRRQAAAWCAAQVEVLGIGRIVVGDRSRPQRSRVALLVTPAAEDPAWPARVGEHARARDFAPIVAESGEGIPDAVPLIVLILLFFTEPVQYLPKAVLGAVIVSAAIGLVDRAAWRALAAIDTVEVAIAAVTAICVVVLGVLEAMVIAVGLSMVDTVRRSAHPYDAVLGWVDRLGRYADVSLHPSARVTPGVVVYRLDDRLFFANARYFKGRVKEAVRAAPQPVSWLVFDAEAVTHADSTGLLALQELVKDLEGERITLVVARLRTRMWEEFEEAGLTETIGPRRFYPSVRAAVDACFPVEAGSA